MNRIKELRKRERLTQQELADKMQTTRVTVSNWETGRHALNANKASRCN